MKVGIISKGSPDYLIDIVTDGVVRLLGRKNVSIDYNVRYGSEARGPYQHLCRGIAGPEPFDIHEAEILIASDRSVDAARKWKARTRRKKIAILDGEDTPGTNASGLSLAKVYFKREYFGGGAYKTNVRPLPFAAIPEEGFPEAKREGIFYSAHLTHPLRVDIAAALSSIGFAPAPNQDKRGYNQKLSKSLIGVSVRGAGWDTYRYWEIPFFGAALLSQRPGHVIPGNFVEDQEAVFYDGVEDFKGKLKALLAQPEETLRIAKAGQRAITERHLSIHRAKTVLESLS